MGERLALEKLQMLCTGGLAAQLAELQGQPAQASSTSLENSRLNSWKLFGDLSL